MKKKFRLSYKVIAAALIFSAVLLSVTGRGLFEVKAGESREAGSEAESEDMPLEPVCECTQKKCSEHDVDRKCGACKADYRVCEYRVPNVVISILQPGSWHQDKAAVSFEVSDVAHTGNFELAKMQAKVGQNGSWTDVTEDKKLEISENCTVYVQVTDQKGNIYEKSRAVRCFDNARPALNAAISDGLLSVQVYDVDSGARAVYVNGYEFETLTNGTLNIRLQQFDAGYEYFTISAMDNAGNMSDTYKVKNPYYKDPSDESDENPAEQLPVSAGPTKPGSATGSVTDHTQTDSAGNTVLKEPEEKQGKEFYTIQTASENVFYLIIDRDGEEEVVYFLTAVTENDLLNATTGNSDTLPKNSVALPSAIPAGEVKLPESNAGKPQETEGAEPAEGNTQEDDTESTENTEDTQQEGQMKEESKTNPLVIYILLGGLAAGVIGGAYYFKVVRKKKEVFLEDEDEDEEEEFEIEDDTASETEDDFFADEDGESDAAETAGE